MTPQDSLVPLFGVIEKAGGWTMFAVSAVVVGRWMVSRMDRMIDTMVDAVATFQKVQIQDEIAHSELLVMQRQTITNLESLRAEILVQKEKVSA